ncbi:MAG: ATP-binding cassette domain-containing protein [Bacteroidetes bacterium]|nr:ATP-binding cassette domain-containing protein [Bacteroidota bacterium]
MHYVTAENLTKSYGIRPLFQSITFHIQAGDKIALIARNGSGKSTLLKILAGKEVPDEGSCFIHKEVQVVLFEQDPFFEEEVSVLDHLFQRKHPVTDAIKRYEALTDAPNDTPEYQQEFQLALQEMEEKGAWDFDAKVKQILSKLRIRQLHQPVRTLSGGQRKRVALAGTLIDIGFDNREVLLIMDEPTNHLDVEMVEWLEQYIDKENLTLLLVSHDRYFLDSVCNEIWELDQGKLFTYKGDYENYLQRKAARIESEAASLDKAKNLFRKELEWMRKQPRARTTKSKSRQDRFYDIETTVKQKRDTATLQLDMKMSRLGGKVVELKKVYKSYGEKIILKGFDYTFKKGERIGVIGQNGAGKSTFLNLLQGKEQADSGKINIGETVVFGHYAQEGLTLKEDMRVIEYVKSIAENFPLSSGGSLSAAQFLQLFLFEPDKQYTYVSTLSGGEKRRLQLLTILFRNPNFLILDEPTNDLDLPTLAVLENFLESYAGCLLMVSHDRYFMDRLVDHLFVFNGNGDISDFPGNYADYRQAKKTLSDAPKANRATEASSSTSSVKEEGAKKRLGFKEKREFEQLAKEIEQLQKEKLDIESRLTDAGLSYQQLNELSERIGVVNTLIETKEWRWLELSEYEG